MRAHPHPSSDLWIFCRNIHERSSDKIDYSSKYYSRGCGTYKFDRTMVTAGAPRMLTISTSPPSAGASSAPAASASSAAAAAGADVSYAPEASISPAAAAVGTLLSSGAGGWRSSCARSSSTVGAGLRLPAGSPTVSHTPSSSSSTGSAGGTSCVQGRLLVSKSTRTTGTRLLCSRRLTL
jgi:hypothetical protein